ncbi:MAG: N-acetylmuramoyl-L-alanine amidase [Bacillota bacterium]|nr:N-acetylmuramoyl-L-alanine amidase [Bacillota bacterium]
MYEVTIMIDAGHGGYDPGAIGQLGTKEKDVVLPISLKVGYLLQYNNIDVLYTRTSDNVPWPSDLKKNLKYRTDMANDAKVDYFISIHTNASENLSANGTETFIVGFGGEAEKLAKAVQNELINTIKLRNRGIKKDNLHVLRETNMPAILVELAFISNLIEEKLLQNDEFQEKCAIAIAKGICKYLGVDFKVPKKSKYFKDIPEDHWSIDYFDEAKELGLIQGEGNDISGFGKPITKEIYVTGLVNLYKKLKGEN